MVALLKSASARRKQRILKWIIVFAATLQTAQAQAPDCNTSLTALQSTYASGNVTTISTAAKDFRGRHACNPRTQQQALSQTSAALAQLAQASVSAGNLDDATEILSHAPAIHWSVLAVRGDIAAQKGARREAAKLYNSALDVITDLNLTPQSDALVPVAQRIAGLAQENVMLAGTLSATVTRGGEAKGVLGAAMRGIAIESVTPAQPVPTTQSDQSDATATTAQTYSETNSNTVVYGAAQAITAVYLPIRFAFGSAELDVHGLHEAEQIATFLQANHIAKITLIGHTDDVGPEHANQKLSLERAKTVQAFLKSKGVTTLVHIDGKGESQPPKLVDPNIYSLEERRAIARRVELVIHS